MTHNYFLYTNPSDGKLNWIPWDNNEALSNDKNMALDFDFNSVSNSEWPLIGYIYDTPEYKTKYDNYIDQFIEADFKPSVIANTYSSWNSLISNSVAAENGNYTYLTYYSDFTNSLNTLNNHASQRYSAASSYTP
jgi:spore coat protein CotH